MGLNSVARTAFIVLATVFALLTVVPDIALPWHPWSGYGFTAMPNGEVRAVDAQSRHAGLLVGDVIDIPRLSPVQRSTIVVLGGSHPYAREGSVLNVPLANGRTVRLVSHPHLRTLAENITDVLQVLAFIVYALIAALLVLFRPMPSTWAFYVFSYYFIISSSSALFSDYTSPLITTILITLIHASHAVSPIAFAAFALRFPNTRPAGGFAVLERILLYFVAPALLLWNVVYRDLLYVAYSVIEPNGAATLFQTVIVALLVLGSLLLLSRYARADEEERSRLQWVVAAFAVAFLPYTLLVAIGTVLREVGGIWVGNLTSTVSVIAPIALAYTILKHRLFDIRLVVSRALIYAVLTTVTVGFIALADWGFGVWLSQSRFALAAEAALALLLGFSLTSLHRRIETSLNAVIFRAQTAALHALRRFTHEVELIPDAQRLLVQVYDMLNGRLEIEYAAVYTADGAAFMRAAGDESSPMLLTGDDFAVLRLRRWSEPFECDDPHHPLRGALLLPMTARTQLVGFIACGQKRDRTHYLPEEIETLAALAHRAGSAYAWLTLRPDHGNVATLSPLGRL